MMSIYLLHLKLPVDDYFAKTPPVKKQFSVTLVRLTMEQEIQVLTFKAVHVRFPTPFPAGLVHHKISVSIAAIVSVECTNCSISGRRWG